ncbi:MAG: BMP family ABC transporter substrate-binding protein [Lachnospiraceae bacterium]|nr:BMP family ABC transporter substrate-binding protein [Lachnospiraceae bacterium]MBQ6196333.1 BMP family ABC transporter substrate-binding protein [Lachnospiraceae bacterium]
MKKLISVLLSLAMILALAACGNNTDTSSKAPEGTTKAADTTTKAADQTTQAAPSALDDFKMGFIFLHDPASSTYDNNFYQAALAVQKELGLKDDQFIFKWNVPEGPECQDTAEEMADAGCKVVFADSFGHETYMIEAAKNYPNVQFCHATGTQSRTVNVANYHNAFASIYEGRYLAGIAAGMKLAELVKEGKTPKVGYVGAYPYAEVVSGFTSFFLGVRSIVPEATMDVVYTNSWFDIALEKEAALKLINDGCVLLSQHADSEGAPKACEEKGIPNVAYNVSTINLGPNTALISSKINWAPYYKMVIDAVSKGESFATDWCGSFATGSVELTELNTKAAAAGTQEAIDKAKAELEAGTLKVFATANWTVKGEHLTEYLADVQDMGDFQPETNVILDGAFVESGEQFRSAPYFDIRIDGITEK